MQYKYGKCIYILYSMFYIMYLFALNSILNILIFSSCFILANLFISSILNGSQGNTTSQDDTKDDHGQLQD